MTKEIKEIQDRKVVQGVKGDRGETGLRLELMATKVIREIQDLKVYKE